nr:GGDEF domain-containing protein [uncultured Rhodoferax sp.]
MSRIRRAREAAELAIQLFRVDGDVLGEAEAFSTLAQVLSVGGHAGKGVEAAQRAAKLSSGLDPVTEAIALCTLGMAHAYNQSFDKSAEALLTSIRIFESEGLWAESSLPRYQARAAVLYQCFLHRYCHGDILSLESLKSLPSLQNVVQGALTQHVAMTCPPGKVQSLLDLSQGFETCWLGDPDGAASIADRVCAGARKGADQPMVWLMEIWLRAEIAWLRKDWPIAEAHAQRLQLLSKRAENEHLLEVSYLLQAQIHSAQGKDGLAQTQLRLLKAHEAQLRNESLHTSDVLLHGELNAPAVTKMTSGAQFSTQQGPFVLKDMLTGLNNRRYLEQVAPGLIARCAERRTAPVMFFLDVDRFRHINASYSRLVGDAVLKVLAQIFGTVAGTADALARLGADEFVILVDPANRDDVPLLIQRIRSEVKAYAWNRLHPELEVSVSCVSGPGEPNDTFDSWLHRCELSMCIEKEFRSRAPA